MVELQNVEELFKEADINGDGTLSYQEFKTIFETAKKRYPQVEVELTAADRNIQR